MSDFETSDIYMAAVLKMHDIPYMGQRRLGTRVFFQFKEGPERVELTRRFHSNEVRVNPKALRDAVRDLKLLIRNVEKDLPAI